MPFRPMGFTAKDLMEAGLKSQPHDPWHDRDPDRWLWHASELSSCPRQLIYKRAGRATDPRPLAGSLTMLVGTVFHREVEKWVHTMSILMDGRVKVVVSEVGFIHPDLPLAAKPDAVLDVEGVGLVVMDFKTEHEDAAKRRANDAREEGRNSHIRPEHALQIAATAVCLEGNGIGPIVQGFALYCSKNSFWLGDPSTNYIELSDDVLRTTVAKRVHALEDMWDLYVKDQEMPDRYPDKHWNCRIDKQTGYGMYCPAYRACRG